MQPDSCYWHLERDNGSSLSVFLSINNYKTLKATRCRPHHRHFHPNEPVGRWEWNAAPPNLVIGPYDYCDSFSLDSTTRNFKGFKLFIKPQTKLRGKVCYGRLSRGAFTHTPGWDRMGCASNSILWTPPLKYIELTSAAHPIPSQRSVCVNARQLWLVKRRIGGYCGVQSSVRPSVC